MSTRAGQRTALVLLATIATLGCSAPNPAYRSGEAILADSALAAEDAGSRPFPPDAPPMIEDAAEKPDTATPAPADAPSFPDASPPDARPDIRVSTLPAPVARWRLDQQVAMTVADETGANPGTLHNGARCVSESFPNAGFDNPGAVTLDGVNDHVELGTSGLPAIGTAMTLSAWFRLLSSPGLGRKNILTLTNPDARESVQLGIAFGTPAVWTWNADVPLARSMVAPAMRWHHVAYTYDGSRVHRLYVDGKPDGVFMGRRTSAAVTSAYLGAYHPVEGEDEKIHALIDDVRIYERALDASQIAALAGGED